MLETALYAADLAAMEAFYTGVMGLEVCLKSPGRHVFFRISGGMLLVFDPTATARAETGPFAAPPHGATGPGHVCFAADTGELDRWRTQLDAQGVAVEDEITWPNGARSLYFRDPAGNSVEIADRWLWD